MHIVIIKYYLA